MKVPHFLIPFIVVLILVGNPLNAQTSDANYQIEQAKDTSYLALSIGFISDAVFMGRKDSISAPYVYPSLTYHHKSGLYANGSLSYLTKSEDRRIDLFLMALGFDFTYQKL